MADSVAPGVPPANQLLAVLPREEYARLLPSTEAVSLGWLRNSGRRRIFEMGLCESLQPGPGADGTGSFLFCNKPGAWFFAGAFFQNEGVPCKFSSPHWKMSDR